MNEYLLIKFLHLLGFAFWIGADLCVFYTSYTVSNEKLSADVRVAAAKIVFALDQIPRICMTLMLPLGIHLVWRMGFLQINALTLSIIWAVAFCWLITVVYLHFATASNSKSILTALDFWFRMLLSISLLGISTAALARGFGAMPYWIALKLMIFGALIGCGLLVRIKLRSFEPAFGRLAAGTAGEVDNDAIRTSLSGTRPIVVAIWIGLLAATALGLHLF